MWKFISRGLRETFERNVRGGLQKERKVQACEAGQQKTCFFRKAVTLDQSQPALYHSGFQGTSSSGSDDYESKRSKRKSTTYQSNCEGWFGAFRCSSYLALGWILAHPCFWRKLCHFNERQGPAWENTPNLASLLSKSVLANPIVEEAVTDRGGFTVQLCSDVVDGSSGSSSLASRQSSSSSSSSSSKETLDKAADDFKSVHNSILAEVENRQGVDLISTNSFEALRLFASATKRGYAPAAYNMAQCFELGVGTKQDFHEAALWYQRAVDLGHSTAMYNLGVFYAHGWGGLKPSKRKARQLFQRAARQGQPDAMSALGMSSGPDEPPSLSPEPEESGFESNNDEFSNFQASNSYKLSPYSPEAENPVVGRLTHQLYQIVSDLASVESRTRVTALDAASFISDFFLPGKTQERKPCIEHEVPGCYVE